MTNKWLPIVLVTFCVSSAASAHDYNDTTVQDQWFTGSLESPSPAIPKAGILGVEPYLIFQGNNGTYDANWARHSVQHDSSQIQEATLLKYSITDQLSVQAVPVFAFTWNGQTTSQGVRIADLPIEFDYRVINQNNKTGAPSVTFILGMSFPTGEYERLHSGLDGLGSGAFTAKEGVLLQSLFDTWDDHPLRLRFWGSVYEPLANAPVHDVSVYGTSQGFQGNALPGISTQAGIGAEYGLNQRWVLALDVVGNYADTAHLSGTDGYGNLVHTNLASSTSLALAPALEYNWSDTLGIIGGVEFSAAGRNSASYIAPQIALNLAF